MTNFTQGASYTRSDILTVLGIPGEPTGNWLTGYHKHNNEWFIFAGVGTAGRTGHDYGNSWLDGDTLRWFGKTSSSVTQRSVADMLGGDCPVHIFWRSESRDPFIYAGVGTPIKAIPHVPVEVHWKVSASGAGYGLYPDEVTLNATYAEGTVKQIMVNAYERNPAARKACIAHFGAICVVCGISFGARYGTLGDGFIHVHHLVPLSTIQMGYQVDPIKDLRPVCPNCRAMLHRGPTPPSLEELKALTAKKAGG